MLVLGFVAQIISLKVFTNVTEAESLHHTATESLHHLCIAKISWTPALAGVSYQFGFNHFSIWLQCKISGSSVFSVFFPHKVSHHKVRKVWSKFLKKASDAPCLVGLKSPKLRFLGFWQKSYPFRYAFFSTKVPMFFWLFAKTTCLEKTWFLIYGPKTWKQIRMQNFLKYNIS